MLDIFYPQKWANISSVKNACAPKTKDQSDAGAHQRPLDQKATAVMEYRIMTSRISNDEVATAMTKATAVIELRNKSLEVLPPIDVQSRRSTKD